MPVSCPPDEEEGLGPKRQKRKFLKIQNDNIKKACDELSTEYLKTSQDDKVEDSFFNVSNRAEEALRKRKAEDNERLYLFRFFKSAKAQAQEHLDQVSGFKP